MCFYRISSISSKLYYWLLYSYLWYSHSHFNFCKSVDIPSLIPDMCLFCFFPLISIPKFLLILFAKFSVLSVFSIIVFVCFLFHWYLPWCLCRYLVTSDFCDPMDCSLPGSSVHGILPVKVLEWVPFPLLGDLPHPGTEPPFLMSVMLAGGFFTTSATLLLLLFSCQVVSNCLRPHELQHPRLPCPSLSLRVCSDSYPLSQ